MRWTDLRWRLVVATVVAAIAPLVLLAAWLATGIERASRDLVRAQLTASLARIEEQLATRWVERRSDVLFLTQNAVAQELVATGATASRDFLDAAYRQLEDHITGVAWRDRHGRTLLAYGDATARARAPGPASVPRVHLTDTLRNDAGVLIGYAESWVEASALMPPDSAISGAEQQVVAFGSHTGEMLRPPPMAVGNDWVVVRDTLAEPPLIVTVAAPIAPVVAPFRRTARLGIGAIATAAILSVLMTLLFAHRLTRSLREVASAADAVASGALDCQLDVRSRDEVGRVAQAFNTMTANLRRTLRDLSQREALAAVGEFAASLSHEVRNGLTSLRIDLQRAEEQIDTDDPARPLVSRSVEKLGRLERTLSGSLAIARTGGVARRTIDLREPLRLAAADAEPMFVERGAALRLDLPDSAVAIEADAAAVYRLFLNLLFNAAHAVDAAGAAYVTAFTDAEEAHVLIHDDGRGIPAAQLASVFQPFHSTRSHGTGLGLPIAQQLARMHGGSIALDSEVGVGTTAHVRLPLRAPPAVIGSAIDASHAHAQ